MTSENPYEAPKSRGRRQRRGRDAIDWSEFRPWFILGTAAVIVVILTLLFLG